MNNNYTAILAAAALLLAGGAQAQHSLSSDPARQAMIQAKLHGPGNHYTPTGERGANDECAGAVPLTVAATCTPTNGDLANATQSQDPATCNNFTADAANDLWFTVTATTANTTFEATGGPEIDPIIEVFSGDCGNLVSEDCSDGTLVEETESVTIPTTVGSAYLVRVYYWIYDSVPTDFSFTVCAYEAEPPPPPPANDACGSASADALSVPGTLNLSGTTVGATDDGDYEAGSGLEDFGPVVWHKFDLAACADISVAYCGTDPAFQNLAAFLARTCPATDADYVLFTSGDFDACGDGNGTVLWDDVEAGTYYLPVLQDVAASANGPYTITVEAVSCVVGIDELTSADWSLFPNPGTGVFNLQYSGKNGLANIEVMDVTGRIVYNEQAQVANGSTQSLDLTGINTGNYNVRLTVDGVRTAQRLTVK